MRLTEGHLSPAPRLPGGRGAAAGHDRTGPSLPPGRVGEPNFQPLSTAPKAGRASGGQALTEAKLAVENACYRGTAGVSGGSRGLGLRPAFFDHATHTLYLSRFADGRVAPCHLLDGLPAELVLTRDASGHACSIRASVEAGFERSGHFYSRAQAVAFADRVERESRLAELE